MALPVVGGEDEAPGSAGTAQTIEVLLQWVHGWFLGKSGNGQICRSEACYGEAKTERFSDVRQNSTMSQFSTSGRVQRLKPTLAGL